MFAKGHYTELWRVYCLLVQSEKPSYLWTVQSDSQTVPVLNFQTVFWRFFTEFLGFWTVLNLFQRFWDSFKQFKTISEQFENVQNCFDTHELSSSRTQSFSFRFDFDFQAQCWTWRCRSEWQKLKKCQRQCRATRVSSFSAWQSPDLKSGSESKSKRIESLFIFRLSVSVPAFASHFSRVFQLPLQVSRASENELEISRSSRALVRSPVNKTCSSTFPLQNSNFSCSVNRMIVVTNCLFN